MNIIEKFSNYWECYEYEVDFKKIESIHNTFESLKQAVKEKTNLRLHVSPHSIIRLAQGSISNGELISLTLNTLNSLTEGPLSKEFEMKNVAMDRIEVFNRNFFMVGKNWISEKNQVDIVSAGRKGQKPRTRVKCHNLNISKNKFNSLSNEEKQELFKNK